MDGTGKDPYSTTSVMESKGSQIFLGGTPNVFIFFRFEGVFPFRGTKEPTDIPNWLELLEGDFLLPGRQVLLRAFWLSSLEGARGGFVAFFAGTVS